MALESSIMWVGTMLKPEFLHHLVCMSAFSVIIIIIAPYITDIGEHSALYKINKNVQIKTLITFLPSHPPPPPPYTHTYARVTRSEEGAPGRGGGGGDRI